MREIQNVDWACATVVNSVGRAILAAKCGARYIRSTTNPLRCKVRCGVTYTYTVLNPEAATLAITKGPDGIWRRGEVECAGNQPVSRLTEAKVDEWLAPYSLSV